MGAYIMYYVYVLCICFYVYTYVFESTMQRIQIPFQMQW